MTFHSLVKGTDSRKWHVWESPDADECACGNVYEFEIDKRRRRADAIAESDVSKVCRRQAENW